MKLWPFSCMCVVLSWPPPSCLPAFQCGAHCWNSLSFSHPANVLTLFTEMVLWPVYLVWIFFFFSNFWLCWVFAVHRLSLTAMSRSCSLVVVPGLLLLQSTGSRAWLTGLVAPRHVGSSQTRDGTCVPNIGRRLWTFVKAVSLPIVAISFVVKDKPVTGSDHTSTPLYCHPCLAQLCGANSIAVFKRWGSPLENPPKTQALIKWVAF